MGRQTDTTPLRMETDQHVLHVLETGSTRPHFSIHHPQPSLDGPGTWHKSRGRGLVSKKGLHNLHWDLPSVAISQVEPTLKPYDIYLSPLNLHRVQNAPLNNLDEAHNCMRLDRPAATDDRECGNVEFLCTLNTPSPERMRYLLDLYKEKKTAHLRRTLLETHDLLRIPLSFWEGACHQTSQGGWWVRALSEELTSKCGKCKRIWPAHQLAKDGCTNCKASRRDKSKAGLAQEDKGGQSQAPADTGPRDAVGPS